MAAKKATTKKKSMKSAGTKGVKKAAPKKASAQTATKAGTPKAGSAKKAAATKGAAKKKAPAVKLTDKQLDLLKKVHAAGTTGYSAEKVEGRSLDTLREKKMVKKLKSKDTGKIQYHLTKAGEKHATKA